MSVSGGTFRGRLSAARMFGFIETENGKVRLSELGLYVLDENTTKSAKAEAFLRVPLYKAMFDSYNGFALPPAAAIERQMQTMGVPPKQVERARQAFAVSAQAGAYIAANGRFSKPTVTPVPAREELGGGNGGGGGGAGGGGGGGNDAGEPPLSPPIVRAMPPATEKALEYKLVDLMSDASGQPEVIAAIITVVTFLTSRNATKKTAADQ